MPELLLEDDGVEAPGVWRIVHIAPWNGDVSLKLRPATKGLLDVVAERAKSNPLYRRHKETIDGKTKTVDGDPNAAWQEEFLKAVVEDWKGVTGEPPCDEEHVVKLRAYVTLVNFISAETSLLAGVQNEDEEKNSENS